MADESGTSARQVAEDCFRRGDLAGCLQSLQDAVRKSPAETPLRIFLGRVPR